MIEPKFFDVHGHLNFAAFGKDRDEVIKRALEAGVFMNVVGTQKDTSRAAVELAEKYEGVYATVGLHPIHTGKSFHDKDEIGEELADVFNWVLLMSHDFGIDILSASARKISKNSLKYPVSKSKGKHTKYNQL